MVSKLPLQGRMLLRVNSSGISRILPRGKKGRTVETLPGCPLERHKIIAGNYTKIFEFQFITV